MVPPRAPPAKPARASWLNKLPTPSAVAAGAAAALVPDNALAASLTVGVATAQVGGTDSVPTKPAWPTPAETADAAAPATATGDVLDPSPAAKASLAAAAPPAGSMVCNPRTPDTKPKIRVIRTSLAGSISLGTAST